MCYLVGTRTCAGSTTATPCLKFNSLNYLPKQYLSRYSLDLPGLQDQLYILYNQKQHLGTVHTQIVLVRSVSCILIVFLPYFVHCPRLISTVGPRLCLSPPSGPPDCFYSIRSLEWLLLTGGRATAAYATACASRSRQYTFEVPYSSISSRYTVPTVYLYMQ